MPDRLGSRIDEERPGSAQASPYPLPLRTRHAQSPDAEFLSAVPMFAGLSEPLCRQIAARATRVQLEAGGWLFRQDDEGDSLYVVRSGRLEVVVERPSTAVVRVLTRGTVVGELALLTRERRSASVRARRDCELLRVSSTDFAELLSHEPRFALALMRELGRQLRVSRGLEPPGVPLPATIAVVPAGPTDAGQFAETLRIALAELGTVTLLDERQARDAALDNAERAHDRVLMLAADPAGADPWSAFALRQAGRPALPPLKETLARSIVLGSIDAGKRARMRADVLIEPVTGDCGMLDFSRLEEMVAAGRRAVHDQPAYAMLRQLCHPGVPLT